MLHSCTCTLVAAEKQENDKDQTSAPEVNVNGQNGKVTASDMGVLVIPMQPSVTAATNTSGSVAITVVNSDVKSATENAKSSPKVVTAASSKVVTGSGKVFETTQQVSCKLYGTPVHSVDDTCVHYVMTPVCIM